MSGERGQVVKAMAVIRRPGDGALLVSEDSNPAGVLFHRPLGGHVEFGEYAEHTVRRELLARTCQKSGCSESWRTSLTGMAPGRTKSCSCSAPRSRTTRHMKSPSSASSIVLPTTRRSFAGVMRMLSARRCIQMASPTLSELLCCRPSSAVSGSCRDSSRRD